MYNIAICDDETALCTQFEHILALYTSEKSISTEVFDSDEELI